MPKLPRAGERGQSLPSLPITSRCPRCPDSRHDRGFSQEGLGSGIILNALDSDFVPSVIAQHHIWGKRAGVVSRTPHGPSGPPRVPSAPRSPPNSPFPMVCSSFRSFMFKAQPPRVGGWLVRSTAARAGTTAETERATQGVQVPGGLRILWDGGSARKSGWEEADRQARTGGGGATHCGRTHPGLPPCPP